MSLLPDVDPVFGIVERYSFDHDTGRLIIARTQLVQDILDNNTELANSNDRSWRKRDDRQMLFASIPNIVIEQWLAEGINVWAAKTDRQGRPNEMLKRVLRKLEDPEWRRLKTTSMRMA